MHSKLEELANGDKGRLDPDEWASIPTEDLVVRLRELAPSIHVDDWSWQQAWRIEMELTVRRSVQVP